MDHRLQTSPTRCVPAAKGFFRLSHPCLGRVWMLALGCRASFPKPAGCSHGKRQTLRPALLLWPPLTSGALSSPESAWLHGHPLLQPPPATSYAGDGSHTRLTPGRVWWGWWGWERDGPWQPAVPVTLGRPKSPWPPFSVPRLVETSTCCWRKTVPGAGAARRLCRVEDDSP